MTADALTVPALDWTGETNARVSGQGYSMEAAGLLLQRAIEQGARRAAGSDVCPVSVTLDTTAVAEGAGPLSFVVAIDRKTRTLVFAHGSATENSHILMTATAVFRIL